MHFSEELKRYGRGCAATTRVGSALVRRCHRTSCNGRIPILYAGVTSRSGLSIFVDPERTEVVAMWVSAHRSRRLTREHVPLLVRVSRRVPRAQQKVAEAIWAENKVWAQRLAESGGAGLTPGGCVMKNYIRRI
jgi:hypothetical protein